MAARKRRRSTKRKSIPTNKALYSRVKAAAKRKFAVYPSAYANAWLVKIKSEAVNTAVDNTMCKCGCECENCNCPDCDCRDCCE